MVGKVKTVDMIKVWFFVVLVALIPATAAFFWALSLPR
jgi:hypothetical protein